MRRRILSIDGGGIKGVFPAAFLATLEDALGAPPIGDHFDLIAGTSTGGIIALGLGMGLSARQILAFYERHGESIFGGNRAARAVRHLLQAKYSTDHLKRALQSVFGNRKLGESTHRLVVPSFNIETGELHVWKTAHHPRLESDFKHLAVEVALSTAAAPTYFPTFRSASGVPLIDGGVWANNPVAIATVEAVGILGWNPANLSILSLGCTAEPLNVNWWSALFSGRLAWAPRLVDVFLAAQSASAIGMTQHLVADRMQLSRINPNVPRKRFDIDKTSTISALKGLGVSEARKALPNLRSRFFDGPVAEEFRPCHALSTQSGPPNTVPDD